MNNTSMTCEIIWNSLSPLEWEARFKKIKRSNILQSYAYARAICKLERQGARWGLIKIDGEEAGLVQLIEVKFCFGLFHAVMLDRGPLWFDEYGGAMHVSAFFTVFDQQFPKRLGRKRRILPEIETGATIEKILTQCGLEMVPTTQKYQTLWWDLTLDDDLARAQLKSNWRGALKKAENHDLEVSWDHKGKFYAWMREMYRQDKQIKGYSGVSPKLLDNMALFSTPQDPMVIGKVRVEGRDIATVMFMCHGQSATYQIGWSSEEGRKYNAHQLLLWQARYVLRSHGITQLDLGGMNDDTAKTIKKFKQGTGAQGTILAGHYR